MLLVKHRKLLLFDLHQGHDDALTAFTSLLRMVDGVLKGLLLGDVGEDGVIHACVAHGVLRLFNPHFQARRLVQPAQKAYFGRLKSYLHLV